MAVELLSENPNLGMSPRISFSQDFCQTDVVPVEQHNLQSNSSEFESDFHFCVRESFDQDSSCADELFSDGKILPIQLKKKIGPPKQMDRSKSKSKSSQPPLPPPPRGSALHHHTSSHENSRSESTKEIKSEINDAYEKQNSKSFWRFKRSSSLNCGSGYGPSLCPLPLLSRSNSTGSEPSVKRSQLSKDNHNHSHNHKQHLLKHSSVSPMKPSQYSSPMSYQKPPLKKNYGAQSNGVRISPVLNVAPLSLFGLASIFNGKEKNRKK